MADGRGYRSYRGRSSKKKMVLAARLLLVILAATGVVLMQKYIFYDETGSPHLEIPWKEASEETEDEVELDLVIRPAEKPEETLPLRGVMLPEGILSLTTPDAILAENALWTATVVTLKDSAGTVYYSSGAATHNPGVVAEETVAALAEWTEGYAVARIACFCDPKASNADAENLGLKNIDGYSFYDGNNSQWLDPAKPAARAYLCSVVREAAELGFREILLTDVAYPTEGKVDQIAYGDGSQQEHLLMFLLEVRAVLEPYGVKLSVEIPAHAIQTGEDALAGLDLKGIAPLVDRICAKVAPAEVEVCTAAVSAAGEKTGFVPILTAEETTPFEQFLIQ